MTTTNDEVGLLKFLDSTIDGILERPALWGPLPSVELQLLRLLEVRAVLLADERHAAADEVAPQYRKYLSSLFPENPLSLRSCIEMSGGSEDDFKQKLREFCDAERSRQGRLFWKLGTGLR